MNGRALETRSAEPCRRRLETEAKDVKAQTEGIESVRKRAQVSGKKPNSVAESRQRIERIHVKSRIG
jgi:hypothetical protein